MEAQVFSYAKNSDLDMLLSLEEMVMCGDGRHEDLFWDGAFKAVAQLLTWWWGDQTPTSRAETGGQNLVPGAVLFMVARLGRLE